MNDRSINYFLQKGPKKGTLNKIKRGCSQWPLGASWKRGNTGARYHPYFCPFSFSGNE